MYMLLLQFVVEFCIRFFKDCIKQYQQYNDTLY